MLCVVALAAGLAAGGVHAPSGRDGDAYRAERDVAYRAEDERDDPTMSRCRLDVHAPRGGEGFATIVWFHAGDRERELHELDGFDHGSVVDPPQSLLVDFVRRVAAKGS